MSFSNEQRQKSVIGIPRVQIKLEIGAQPSKGGYEVFEYPLLESLVPRGGSANKDEDDARHACGFWVIDPSCFVGNKRD